MQVLVLTATLYCPWVQSLKEKRMELRSLTAKLRNKFHVSVAETGAQDLHKTIEISIAAIGADSGQVDSISNSVRRFIEGNTEAEHIEFSQIVYSCKSHSEKRGSLRI